MDLGVILGILGGLFIAWALMLVLLWIVRPRDVPLRDAIRLVPDVLRLIRSLIADGTAPVDVRLASIGLLVWLVSPIDLVPEFIPVLGPIDDIVVAVLVLRHARRRLGESTFRQRWPGTEDGYRLLQAVLR